MLTTLMASARPAPPVAKVVDPEAATVPYPMRGKGPFNAPQPCNIIVDSGTPESCTHPSVWDFGPGKAWNGYRYWMAITDYGGSHNGENPNVLASHDGFNWEWPAGLTNPIWRVTSQNAAAGTTPLVSEPAQQWNSDTEVWYDDKARKLVVFWREMFTDSTGPERLWSSSSADGVTWEKPVIRYETGASPSTGMSMLSPSICKVSDTDWRMFTWGLGFSMRTAPSLYGPWSAPVATSGHGGLWHAGAWYENGTFYALGGDPCRAVTSTDGITWKQRSIVLDGYPGSWDAMLYRPMLRPHPDGKHFRVWYSSQGIWRAGYTVVPRSLWD